MNNANKRLEGPLLKRTLVVLNHDGVHCKQASLLASKMRNYGCEIYIEKSDGLRVNGKSVISILVLEASKGTKLSFIAAGEDAKEALDAAEILFRECF